MIVRSMFQERASLLQKALGLDNTRTLDNKQSNELATDLLLSKKSSTDLPTTVPNRDQDYEELLERLRVADFLYTEYSLEEVIYQLAKVMFSQSLNRGSGEAQEALQKFTSFLESEAEQGHISRSLEKKVLDVLIASLTDTLTEHPHLVSAAREGLGSNLPKTAGNQLLHQLLLLNPAGASGETASAGTDINKSDKSHQSTLAKTRAESNKTT
ncbi:unnamed protein product [Timema podura]|uniref:Uncharacterized protein n=1 Tax=Timema podura TaxID=61482 RepID=A0ABN7PJK9_TIMPD|nr:unnamed protein product [Timema podura]